MEEVSLREFLEQRLTSQDQTLGRIEEQVKKTNGRVTALENRMAYFDGWRNRVVGAIAVIAAIVIPIAVEFFKK